MSSLVILDMALDRVQQLVVLHIPYGLGRRTSRDVGQVGNELTEPEIRGVLDQLGQRTQDVTLQFCTSHGSVSPSRGRWPRGSSIDENPLPDSSPKRGRSGGGGETKRPPSPPSRCPSFKARFSSSQGWGKGVRAGVFGTVSPCFRMVDSIVKRSKAGSRVRSSQQVLNDSPVDIGQSHVASTVEVCQEPMIEAQEVQDCGM